MAFSTDFDRPARSLHPAAAMQHLPKEASSPRVGTIVVVLAVAELGERRKRVWQRAIGGAMGLLGRSMSRRPALRGLDP